MRGNLIFLSIVLGFLGGILCRSFIFIGAYETLFALLLVIVLGAAYVRWKRRIYLYFVLALIFASLGIARVALVPVHVPPDLQGAIGSEVRIEGRIAEDPDVRESSQRLVVQRIDGTRVLVVAALFPEYSLGEFVEAKGLLESPEAFATDSGRTFRYDRFLAKDGIFLILRDASLTYVSGREGIFSHIRGSLSDIKHAFMRSIGDSLPEPHASLASGMLLGGKQGLGEELVSAFTVTGLIHIVVLSGYNIMIIAETIMRGVSFLPRRIALSVAIASIGVFVLTAGAGAAALRAGIMAIIALAARVTGRTYAVLRALGLAVVFMLAWNPLLLAFDPGFQLSVAATLGLILGAPIVERYINFVRPNFIREILAATIAAQVFVLPLLLYQTGSLSLVSLPANILVLPFVPLAMMLSFGSSLVSLVVPGIAAIAGFPAYLILGYVLDTTQFLASIPFAQVVLPAFPFILVAFMYVLLAVFVYKKTLDQTSSSSMRRSATDQLTLERNAST